MTKEQKCKTEDLKTVENQKGDRYNIGKTMENIPLYAKEQLSDFLFGCVLVL